MSSWDIWSHNTRFYFRTSINSHDVLSPISERLIAKNTQKRLFIRIANRILTVYAAARTVFLTRTVAHAAGIAFRAELEAVFLAAASLAARGNWTVVPHPTDTERCINVQILYSDKAFANFANFALFRESFVSLERYLDIETMLE